MSDEKDIKVQKELINQKIIELKYIEKTLSLFHKDKYREEIRKIKEILENLKRNKTLQNKDNKQILEDISNLSKLKSLCSVIDKVKDLLLFKIIYKNVNERDQENRFNKAITLLDEINKDLHKDSITIKELYSKNKIIFDKIIEKLGNNEELFNRFIQQIVVYFNLDKIGPKFNDLIILFQSKKYEKEINSIAYFFKNFQDDKHFFNKFPNNYETLSQKDFDEFKKDLEMLKNEGIYNYVEKKNYLKFFFAFYEQNEAINYLLSYIDKIEQIRLLYDKLDPNNKAITIRDIKNLEECIKTFKRFKELKNNFEIFNYIKQLTTEQIDKFISYSKNYLSFIDLENDDYFNDNFGDNIYHKINGILDNSSFNFNQDNESFFLENNNEIISFEELINLKNKITIKDEKSKEYYTAKLQKLNFFKILISNTETIYNNMIFFRIKGCNLPISIKINTKHLETKYIIEEKEKSFEEIINFLSKVKSDYISQLDYCYKNDKYLRFLYGKLFRKLVLHLQCNYDIDIISRFILNKINNNEIIKDGELLNNYNANDYLSHHQLMIENSFQNISNYLITLFNNNETSFYNHYNKILIKGINNYKGIYLHKCIDESMEEFVIKIYIDKLGQLPMAQNILFCNQETTQEEMQAFFYRSILCDYNTLFTVIINDSFSDYQQNLMYNFISELLSYRREIMKIKNEKEKTNTYLDSCIIFVYGDNINDLTFLGELGEDIKFGDENINTKFNDNSIIKNVKVISSDFCGLGKSYEIKKEISEYNKIYYYFTISETDSKNDIFVKLENLLKKIKKENKENYDKIAIHLDMPEHGDISIINEFLFSFLITKFYCYNGNIIFIPNEIEIYVEIPNNFNNNYLSKYGLLNIFERKNITLDKMPKLDLPKEAINIFKNTLGYDSLDKIEQFIKDKIGMKNYSYYQVQIFLKILISQLSNFKGNIKFIEGGKDVTEKTIMEIVNSTKYFVSNSFSRILLQKNANENNFIELCSKIYDYDLENIRYDLPLVSIQKGKYSFDKIYIGKEKVRENKSDNHIYLGMLKSFLNLQNDIEKDIGENKSLLSILNSDNYILTNDIFRKMVLIYYRIKANIPVILIGEEAIGKLSLVIKLNQLLNNGEKTIRVINIHPDLSELKICNIMKEINERSNLVKKETWVYFDNIYTCPSFSLIKEIFINRTFNGEKLNDKIRIIGAYCPYRPKRKNFHELKRGDNRSEKLVNKVKTLPLSLLYFVFNFGYMNQEDEKKYIFSILNNLFTEEEKNLHLITTEIILKCNEFLRKIYDPSIISLGEISKFLKLVQFFMRYYEIKEECMNKKGKQDKNLLFKIKSIICSIYICYYNKLSDEMHKHNFNFAIKSIILKLVNSIEENDKNEKTDEFIKGSLFDEIKYKPLKEDLSNEEINNFSDLLKIEQDFILNKIELDIGIGKNDLLKENIFLSFISLLTNIPLILIGQTGTSKSLSIELIKKSMKGKYSKDKFFKKFPRIIPIELTCSDSTTSEDIENIFEIANNKFRHYYNKNNKEMPIFVILFDKIHLLETKIFNILCTKLKYEGINERINFIGLSNYNLNTSLINNSFVVCLPNLEEQSDNLLYTTRCIVESIDEDLSEEKIFEILSRSYYEYKNKLYFIQKLIALKKFTTDNEDENDLNLEHAMFEEIQVMNDFRNVLENTKTIEADFHRVDNFFDLIKGIVKDMEGLNYDEEEIAQIVKKHIEINFGGLDYEIDIDLNLKFDDIRREINLVKDILDGGEKINDKIRIGSEVVFKNIYNLMCKRYGLNDYQI